MSRNARERRALASGVAGLALGGHDEHRSNHRGQADHGGHGGPGRPPERPGGPPGPPLDARPGHRGDSHRRGHGDTQARGQARPDHLEQRAGVEYRSDHVTTSGAGGVWRTRLIAMTARPATSRAAMTTGPSAPEPNSVLNA